MKWVPVNHPIEPGDSLPAERRVVLVWCKSSYLPWVGYLRYAAGCLDSPYFVVPHDNDNRPTDVVAWCDCLPMQPPEGYVARLSGSGFPAGVALSKDQICPACGERALVEGKCPKCESEKPRFSV